MSAVVFGSPEAQAIAGRDRQLDREAEAMLRAYGETGDAGIDELRRERKELEDEIADLEEELSEKHFALTDLNVKIDNTTGADHAHQTQLLRPD